MAPPCLSWLQDKAPRTYRMILDADKASRQRYSGHGSAMAQVYNHIIMPLASERDARTQVRWGIADFEHRFGRKPEGHVARRDRRQPRRPRPHGSGGHQVHRPRAHPMRPHPQNLFHARPLGSKPLTPPPTPTRPYTIQLDEGRSIAVFFYDGPGSRAIAFEGLLNSGEDFGRRLLGGLKPTELGKSSDAQLSHVATDGESYGHHHKHGEMALSYAMHWIDEGQQAQLTNYGEFLEKFPPPMGSRGSREHLLVLHPWCMSAGAPTAAAMAASPAGTRSGAALSATPSISSATRPPRSPKN